MHVNYSDKVQHLNKPQHQENQQQERPTGVRRNVLKEGRMQCSSVLHFKKSALKFSKGEK